MPPFAIFHCLRLLWWPFYPELWEEPELNPKQTGCDLNRVVHSQTGDRRTSCGTQPPDFATVEIPFKLFCPAIHSRIE